MTVAHSHSAMPPPSNLPGSCLEALSSGAAPALTQLNLSHCMRLEGQHLQHLGQLPNLQLLDLTGCQGPAVAGMSCLPRLRSLATLRVAGWSHEPPGLPDGCNLQPPQQRTWQQRQEQQGHEQALTSGGDMHDVHAGGSCQQGALAVQLRAALAADGGCASALNTSQCVWHVPAAVERLDLRGARMGAAALKWTLLQLPLTVQSLDLSALQVVHEGRRPGGDSVRGGGGMGQGVGTSRRLLLAPGAADDHLVLHTAAASGGVNGLPTLTSAGEGPEGRLLCARDVQDISRLTALTGLTISGVTAPHDRSCTGSADGGTGAAAAAAFAAAQLGCCSLHARRGGLWEACGLAALEWRVTGDASVGWVEQQQLQQEQRWVVPGALGSAAAQGSSKRGGSIAVNVRRVLDLDACARFEAAPTVQEARPFGFGSPPVNNSECGGFGAGTNAALLGGWPDPGGMFQGGSWQCDGWGPAATGGCGWCREDSNEPDIVCPAERVSPCCSCSSVSSCTNRSSMVLVAGAARTPIGVGGCCAAVARGPGSSRSVDSGHSRGGLRCSASREHWGCASTGTHPCFSSSVPTTSWLSPLTLLRHLSVTNSPWLSDSVLASLSGLCNLQHLDVSGCRALTGCGFGQLVALTALTELVCTGCCSLGDAGAKAIAAAFGGGLKRLDLAGCEALGEGCAEWVGAIRNLRRLSLAGNRNVYTRCAEEGHWQEDLQHGSECM